jgi:hypothetical protein
MPMCIAFGPIFCGAMMLKTIEEIDGALSDAGLKASLVLREAGLGSSYLYHVRRGMKPLTPRVAERIRQAISELRRQQKLAAKAAVSADKEPADPSRSRCAAQYRMAVGFVALAADVSPKFILSADPARRATADADWLRASRLRWIALYIANCYLHVSQADLARAACMSRANVCRSLQDLEDRRGDAEIETILAAIEEAFKL